MQNQNTHNDLPGIGASVCSIYSTRCWVQSKLQPATISYSDGMITAIEFFKTEGAQDVGNAVIMPGVIDAHVHINEPGRTEWEGFETAIKAAAAGGITCIVDMPLNASPVTTSVAAFRSKLAAASGKLYANVGFYGGLVPGNVHELIPLIEAGILGVKCFLTPSGIDEFENVSTKDLEEAMPVIAATKIPLLAHCELQDDVIKARPGNDPGSYQAYLASRPKYWENNAVALMISLCQKHHCATHIVHVSSAEALPIIEQAKAKGLPLTAETCAHYIYFNAEKIPDGNTLFKCAPPIREVTNNNNLKQALATGILDFITSDHSPAPPAIKEIESGNLQKAWGGIAGLQWLLPAAFTGIKQHLCLSEFIPLLTEKPAGFLKLQHRKGFLKVGYDADIVIWQPETDFVVNASNTFHKHKASPYIGELLFGTVLQTIVNGITVFFDGRIQVSKACGEIVLANTKEK